MTVPSQNLPPWANAVAVPPNAVAAPAGAAAGALANFVPNNQHLAQQQPQQPQHANHPPWMNVAAFQNALQQQPQLFNVNVNGNNFANDNTEVMEVDEEYEGGAAGAAAVQWNNVQGQGQGLPPWHQGQARRHRASRRNASRRRASRRGASRRNASRRRRN